MALRIAGKPVVVEKHTDFDLKTTKKGELVLRATTHDGKKYLLATITPDGLKLRPRNNHPDLGIKVNAAGSVVVA